MVPIVVTKTVCAQQQQLIENIIQQPHTIYAKVHKIEILFYTPTTQNHRIATMTAVVALSYVNFETFDSNMKLFMGDDADEKAKTWLIRELYRSINTWSEIVVNPDTGKEAEIWHSNPKDIKRALEKETLDAIIEELTMGDKVQVYYECKNI